MDPLSVTASIVGLIAAASKITSLLFEITNNLNDAPSLMRHVMNEVQCINSAICSLQAFLWREAHGSKPPEGEAMILIDHLVITLTGCVCTFSELEVEINALKSMDGERYIDRVKWAIKQPTVSQLLQRLQNHKSSLVLMLNILERLALTLYLRETWKLI